MPKSTQSKTKIKLVRKESSAKPVEEKNSIWDIIKFGESYTSLILGIIVVVVATVLLLTFVKGKNVNPNLSEGQKQNVAVKTQQKDLSLPTQEVTQKLPKNEQIIPTKTNVVISPTIVKEQPKIAVNTVKEQTKNQTISGSKYTIKQGDTLWKIAESKYKSGYNWVDIQKANKITNPDVLYVGTNLTLPNAQPKVATVIESGKTKVNVPAASVAQTNKIVGNSYTIAKGDTLWDIAVRAYGDGYSWQKIARVNNLSNPGIIHTGNKITIPRS